MCQLIGLSNKTHLRCELYFCYGIHLLTGSILSVTINETFVVMFCLIELYMIGSALIGIYTNTPSFFLIMLCYRIVTAVFVGGVVVVVALIHEPFAVCLFFFVLLTFEIYLLSITVKLYPEIKRKIGHSVSPPEITEGSNCTPNVIVDLPQATHVPSISNVVFHVHPNTIVQAEIPNYNSYPPDYFQPAFNPEFILSSNSISHN